MYPKLDKNNYGKLFLIGGTVLVWVAIIILFNVYGYTQTLKLWRVPFERDFFWDFRLIPGSAESFRNGFEPSVVNPFEAGQRIFNYPAFWRLFFYTGIHMSDTVWIGICMIVLFFLGVFAFPQRLSILGAMAMLFVLFSPAAMLLYERGNVDLVVFFLCTMIVLASGYSPSLTAMLVVLGAIVKMYPFWGVTVLLNQTKSKFWLLLTCCLTIVLGYMASTWSSIKASWNLTMRGSGLSYGTNVFVERYKIELTNVFMQWFSPTQVQLLLKYGPLLAALMLILAVLVLGAIRTQSSVLQTERNLAAFRMGASIYVGTFLLGNNWDYRLAFLVLVVPQLVEWSRSTDSRLRFVSRNCLVALYISCWHFVVWFSPYISPGPRRLSAVFIFDELVNWLLMGGLAYLLALSVPAWLKEQATSILTKRRSVSSLQS